MYEDTGTGEFRLRYAYCNKVKAHGKEDVVCLEVLYEETGTEECRLRCVYCNKVDASTDGKDKIALV